MKIIIISCFVILFFMPLNYSYSQQALEYSDKDSIIEAKAGEDITINLESNQITGFKWRLAKPLDENVIKLVNVKYVLGIAKFRGAGGKEVWSLKAIGAGKATISLEYIRPWENNPVPMKKKTFEVTIEELSSQDNAE